MKEEKTDISIFCKSENLRLYIIEHSLHIETLISEAIGSLLGIDYEISKSFGFGSSSLSFNQKVQIVQDIKGIESEMTKKLTCLMNIRNKFAHIEQVDSFEEFFKVAKNGDQIMNQLEKWNSLDDKKDEDEKYKFLFFKLSEEITKMLVELQVQERLSKSVLQMEKEFQKSHLEAFNELVSEQKDGEKLSSEILNRTMQKLPHLQHHKKKK